jgi:hypothetical protein
MVSSSPVCLDALTVVREGLREATRAARFFSVVGRAPTVDARTGRGADADLTAFFFVISNLWQTCRPSPSGK